MNSELDHLMSRAGLSQGLLHGKTVVVTGAGRGIGREAALAFAWCGAALILAEISPEGETTAADIRAAGGQAVFVGCDVSDPASVAALVAACQEYGGVDILVNNAALAPFSRVMDMDPDLWDRVMAVNLRGTFLTCRACLPSMLDRGEGVIINFVSLEGMPGLSAYIASKQGITGFTQSLALEVGDRGVRVIAFGPGMVDTPAIRGLADQLAPHIGLTADQFLSASLHPAYDGLMPAVHAGVATVALATLLADEKNGEQVTGYEVLERVGVISAGAESATQTGVVSQQDADSALPLARELLAVLEATDEEFNHLPLVFRPMARSGFKKKAVLSVMDWKRALVELMDALSAGKVVSSARLLDLLPKLRQYFEEVPAEVGRFSKDPAFLKETAEIASRRCRLIDDLRRSLVQD